jgi:hypothetical protein
MRCRRRAAVVVRVQCDRKGCPGSWTHPAYRRLFGEPFALVAV